jgi:hypothetical protein
VRALGLAAGLLLCGCERPATGGRIVVRLESGIAPDKAAAVIGDGFRNSPYKDFLVEPDSPRVAVSFLAERRPDEALHQVAQALMQWSGSVLRLESAQVVRFRGVARPAEPGRQGTFRFRSARPLD